jgi:crossover junction endodeoxyribonuclease RuvC
MRVLGVDPATIRAGWAIVEDDGQIRITMTGVILMAGPRAFRVTKLYESLRDGIKRYEPDVVAIEDGFIGTNPKTGIAIGQARAAVMIAATQAGVPYFEYAPQIVKRAATQRGNAKKEDVRIAMSVLAGVEIPDYDQADAAAVAVAHCCQVSEDAIMLRVDRP